MKEDTKWMENEANVFAVCLLIPEKLIMEDLKKGFDLGDDKTMRDLCKKYDVPLNALAFRISLLNLKK